MCSGILHYKDKQLWEKEWGGGLFCSSFSHHSKGQLIRDASVRNSGQKTSEATINVIIRPSYVGFFSWLHPCIRVMQTRFFFLFFFVCVYFFHDLIITVGQYIKWSLILPLCCLGSLGYDCSSVWIVQKLPVSFFCLSEMSNYFLPVVWIIRCRHFSLSLYAAACS